MSNKDSAPNHLTIGGIVYKTAGNILFSEGEEGQFFLAESTLLDKVDQAIQDGILVNGMQALLKKVKG
jgi:hypothetical protein